MEKIMEQQVMELAPDGMKENENADEAAAMSAEAAVKQAPEEALPAKKRAKKTDDGESPAPKKRGRPKKAQTDDAEASAPDSAGKRRKAAKADDAADVKTNFVLQYGDKDVNMAALEERAKEAWKNDFDGDVGNISSLDLYVKPEENKVYYVVNGEQTGSYDI